MIYLHLHDPNRNYLYYDTNRYIEIIVPTRNLEIGEVIDTNSIEVVKYNADYIYNLRKVYIQKEEAIGKKVLYPLFTGQLIYKEYTLSKEEWYDGKTLFPIEIDVASTVANSVVINDYVDINVALKNKKTSDSDFINYDVVAAKLLVEDVKNENGESFKDIEDKVKEPRYVLVKLTSEEIDRYLDAVKKGDIFLTVYDDPTSPPSKVTYEMKEGGGIKNES